MKLQPAQLEGRAPLSGSDGVAGTRPQATAAEQAAPAVVPRQPRTGSALARGQALNAQITGAQQALGFLNRAAEQLQGLKQAVGARLAGKSSDQAGLQRQLDDFTSSWSQRPAAAAWMPICNCLPPARRGANSACAGWTARRCSRAGRKL